MLTLKIKNIAACRSAYKGQGVKHRKAPMLAFAASKAYNLAVSSTLTLRPALILQRRPIAF